MIYLFISYGGKDRAFARKLSEKINSTFKGKITTRVIEDHTPYDGKDWKEKVIEDLNKTSIFIIIFTQKSTTRQWPNQELGYAKALLDIGKLQHLIPVVEVEKFEDGKPIYISLSGFITEDMDKIPFLPDKQKRTINRIIKHIEKMDLNEIEKSINPNLADLTKEEIQILEFIVRKTFEEEDSIYIQLPISKHFPDLQESFIDDTIEFLDDKDIIDRSGNHLIKLTSFGFSVYGSLFLDFDVIKIINSVFDTIISFGRQEEICDGSNIHEATDLTPKVINYSVKVLEDKGEIIIHQQLGTAPYHFYSVELSLESKRKHIVKNE